MDMHALPRVHTQLSLFAGAQMYIAPASDAARRRRRERAEPRMPTPRDIENSPQRRRTLPARDARGRFVAFPTTSAPSWYVLDAAAYRIPEAAAEPEILPGRTAAPPRPRARRLAQWRAGGVGGDVRFALTMLVFVAVMFVYALQLPRPHH